MLYTVDLNAGVTDSLFSKLEQMNIHGLQTNKRLTGIVLELMSNMYRHAPTLNTASLHIRRKLNTYSIVSTNSIEATSLLKLVQDVQAVNHFKPAELDHQYKIILSKQLHKPGGLGLYQIARRCHSKLKASFMQADKTTYTFTLHVNLVAHT